MEAKCQNCQKAIQGDGFLCPACAAEFSEFTARQAESARLDDQSFWLTPKGVIAAYFVEDMAYDKAENIADEILERLQVHAARHAEGKIPAIVLADGKWEFVGLEQEK
jgi:predicted amidophosphoribosyltransferase